MQRNYTYFCSSLFFVLINFFFLADFFDSCCNVNSTREIDEDSAKFQSLIRNGNDHVPILIALNRKKKTRQLGPGCLITTKIFGWNLVFGCRHGFVCRLATASFATGTPLDQSTI